MVNFVCFPVVLVCGGCALGLFLGVEFWCYFLLACWLFGVLVVASLVCRCVCEVGAVAGFASVRGAF